MMNQETIRYLESLYKLPYRFGGDEPFRGFDCSGLVMEGLKAAGMPLPSADMTSQQLHDFFSFEGIKGIMGPGSLCFYGESNKNVSHVTIMINTWQCIGANGGHSSTDTLSAAILKKAFIKLRPFDYRKDLIGIYMPRYRS
jgi:cell wall-associated NlpC family hydrolase